MSLTIHSLLFDVWCLVGALYLASAPFTRPTRIGEPLSHRILPIFGACAGLILLFSANLPLGMLNTVVFAPTRHSIATGVTLCLCGWTLAVWARLQLSQNWSAWVTLREDHELVQKGPYAVLRHPIYSGFLLAFLGMAILNGLLRSLLGFALIALTWHYKARSEERLMQHAFGPAYDEYRSRTGSMVPRLR